MQRINQDHEKSVSGLERLADARLEPAGVPTSVFRVLRPLDLEPGQSAADLARHLGFAPQSVASLIERAERSGYLEWHPHPVHGRVLQMFLTESGREAFARARRVVRSLERDLTRDMDAAARKAFSRQIMAITLRAEALSQAGTRPPRL